MSNWIEHQVKVYVNVPLEQVWQPWSDLEQMPCWVRWIKSVEILDTNPELSRWTLAVRGFRVSWVARTLVKIPLQTIQWESVNGIGN